MRGHILLTYEQALLIILLVILIAYLD